MSNKQKAGKIQYCQQTDIYLFLIPEVPKAFNVSAKDISCSSYTRACCVLYRSMNPHKQEMQKTVFGYLYLKLNGKGQFPVPERHVFVYILMYSMST